MLLSDALLKRYAHQRISKPILASTMSLANSKRYFSQAVTRLVDEEIVLKKQIIFAIAEEDEEEEEEEEAVPAVRTNNVFLDNASLSGESTESISISDDSGNATDQSDDEISQAEAFFKAFVIRENGIAEYVLSFRLASPILLCDLFSNFNEFIKALKGFTFEEETGQVTLCFKDESAIRRCLARLSQRSPAPATISLEGNQRRNVNFLTGYRDYDDGRYFLLLYLHLAESARFHNDELVFHLASQLVTYGLQAFDTLFLNASQKLEPIVYAQLLTVFRHFLTFEEDKAKKIAVCELLDKLLESAQISHRLKIEATRHENNLQLVILRLDYLLDKLSQAKKEEVTALEDFEYCCLVYQRLATLLIPCEALLKIKDYLKAIKAVLLSLGVTIADHKMLSRFFAATENLRYHNTLVNLCNMKKELEKFMADTRALKAGKCWLSIDSKEAARVLLPITTLQRTFNNFPVRLGALADASDWDLEAFREHCMAEMKRLNEFGSVKSSPRVRLEPFQGKETSPYYDTWDALDVVEQRGFQQQLLEGLLALSAGYETMAETCEAIFGADKIVEKCRPRSYGYHNAHLNIVARALENLARILLTDRSLTTDTALTDKLYYCLMKGACLSARATIAGLEYAREADQGLATDPAWELVKTALMTVCRFAKLINWGNLQTVGKDHLTAQFALCRQVLVERGVIDQQAMLLPDSAVSGHSIVVNTASSFTSKASNSLKNAGLVSRDGLEVRHWIGFV